MSQHNSDLPAEGKSTPVSGTDGIAHWLIHHAARGAPALLAERLEEEWQADLAARSQGPSRLRFALGCCWATKLIARAHRTSSVPASASAAGGIAYLHEDSGLFSRRPASFFLVVCLHAALFYALVAGLGSTFRKTITAPLQTKFLDITRPREPPPPPPQGKIPPTRIKASIPDVLLPADPNGGGDVIRATPPDEQPPTQPPSEPYHVPIRVQGGPGYGFPNPDDYYSPASIRLEEQGNVIVQVCVDASGRLTSDPKAVQSSGKSRLDESALVLAKAASGHYRASTEDGRPVSACYPLRVVFKLKY